MCVKYIKRKPMSKRIFTDYEINDIIKTYNETGSLTKTSEKHNTTNGKIKTLLTKYANIIDFSLNIKINEETKQQIIKEYVIDELPHEHFEKKYNLLKDTLIKNIKSWGIKLNRASNSGKRGKRKLTPEQEKEICRLYTEEGLSTWKIGPKFDVLNVCILQVLRRNNIPRRSRSNAARIYNLDENYFEKCDSPSKAYFLGLMYAEGHLESEGRNTIILALQEEDKYIIDWLQKELKSDRPLEYRAKTQDHHKNAYALKVSSLKFMQDLGKLGLPMGHKCHTIRFPDFLDKSLYKYFILSYFDGDGCVNLYKNQLHMSFCGNIQFLEGLKIYFYKEFNIKTRLYPKNDTTASLEIKQYDAVNLFNWFYQDVDKLPFFMVRKFKKYSYFVRNKLELIKTSNFYRNQGTNKSILENASKIIQCIESNPKFSYLLEESPIPAF